MIEALYDEPSGMYLVNLRQTRPRILTYGYELVLGSQRQKKSAYISKNQVLHVSSTPSIVIHA